MNSKFFKRLVGRCKIKFTFVDFYNFQKYNLNPVATTLASGFIQKHTADRF